PMKRIGGNQLGGVYLWVTGSGGIASVILTALNANKMKKILFAYQNTTEQIIPKIC
ncbi:MAG: hypothetical protein EZS28_044838, partial [Streblomastix strix]